MEAGRGEQPGPLRKERGAQAGPAELRPGAGYPPAPGSGRQGGRLQRSIPLRDGRPQPAGIREQREGSWRWGRKAGTCLPGEAISSQWIAGEPRRRPWQGRRQGRPEEVNSEEIRLAPYLPQLICLLASLLALSIAGPSPARSQDSEDDPSPSSSGKPRLVLQASPRHGFQPLDVALYARLEDVPEGELRFCHAGVEWIGETRSGRVMRSTEDARCIHPEDVKRVDHSFSKEITISRPSIYRYSVILHLKGGELIRSNVVEVRVLSTH
jgi:hypothetical protein